MRQQINLDDDDNMKADSSPTQLRPRRKDICFGKTKHEGNIIWHEAVAKAAKEHVQEEYCPAIHKEIRKSLGTAFIWDTPAYLKEVCLPHLTTHNSLSDSDPCSFHFQLVGISLSVIGIQRSGKRPPRT